MSLSQTGLFPVFDVPGEVAETEVQEQRLYNPAPLFDVQSGEFIENGARQPLYGNGADAWRLWCIKSILTQRFAHFGYSSDIGIEAVEAFRESDRQAQESAFERTITEALLADPAGRTQAVRDFRFDWWSDRLFISCDVVGVDGNNVEISANLERGA
jgi:hypothetical protein